MAEERPIASRAELAKTATTRYRRRDRPMPPEVERRVKRGRRAGRTFVAAGGAGIVAGVGLVIVAHPAIGALPLILGAIVLYRGERMLARVDALVTRHRVGPFAAAALSGSTSRGEVDVTLTGFGDTDHGGGGCGGGGGY
jgi:hypothetical protein